MPAAVVGVVEAEQVSSPALLSMLGRQFDKITENGMMMRSRYEVKGFNAPLGTAHPISISFGSRLAVSVFSFR
jgi:hypothetical protein